MNKNKRGILLSTMTEEARRKHGLTQPDGKVASLWSQGAESAHVKLKRRIMSMISQGNKLSFLNVLRAIEAYFNEERNNLLQARYLLGTHTENNHDTHVGLAPITLCK